MTMTDLEARLGPITSEALASDDPNVKQVGVILAATLRCIAEDWIDPNLKLLVIQADFICKHLHRSAP